MAIPPSMQLPNLFDDPNAGGYLNLPDIKVQDIAIGGKAVKYQAKLTHEQSATFETDYEFQQLVKNQLIKGLVNYIIDNKLCETTVQRNPIDDSMSFFARMYLAPNDQIKLLRVHNYVK